MDLQNRLPAYVTELIGTYFLVLSIGLSTELGPFAPLAIACVLAAAIYAGGHISGAHYNPIITLAMRVRGRYRAADIAPYVVSQLLGAASAALTAGYLAAGRRFEPLHLDIGPALVSELVFTFALAWVILNVATAKSIEGNGFYGVAIAAVVAAGIYAVGPISGAAFNPAVSVALCLLGLAEWSALWIHWLPQVGGALLAAWVANATLD